MALRRVGIAATTAIALAALAACQPGAALPVGSQPAGATSIPNQTSAANTKEPPTSLGPGATGLDGTLTFTSDEAVSSEGVSSEEHQKLSITVHLVIQGEGPDFVDAGSTYTFSETTRSDRTAVAPFCGDHSESTGTGGGAFTEPDGDIGALYGNYDPPEVSLSVQAPYLSTSTGHVGCVTVNGTDHDNVQPVCNDPADADLIGIVEPGIVQAPAPGQTIDFTCNEPFGGGEGRVTVTGTLTSR